MSRKKCFLFLMISHGKIFSGAKSKYYSVPCVMYIGVELYKTVIPI